ncbi:unnamed protein product [Ascophyllum nodosum]
MRAYLLLRVFGAWICASELSSAFVTPVGLSATHHKAWRCVNKSTRRSIFNFSDGPCLYGLRVSVSTRGVAPRASFHSLRMGARTVWNRVRGRGVKSQSEADLKKDIASFYDSSSNIWEDIWGEHMHHGYYVEGRKPKTIEDHRAAQKFMVTRSLEWAGVQEGASAPKTGLDVGCGIGGSSRVISTKYGTAMTGITLSPVQRDRAQAISEEAGLGKKCKFLVADGLNTPFARESFDLVWSMECGEHMAQRSKWVAEMSRICAPGGRILVVAWCHRNLQEGEAELTPKEQKLLKRISKVYCLPQWCSPSDYVKYYQAQGLVDIKTDDWTDNIQEFWPAVIRSSLTPKGIFGLIKSGPSTIKAAIAMLLMVRGYKTNLVKFALITAKKP